MHEIWKPIENYDDYMVSSLGRVKSIKKYYGEQGRILKPFLTKKGYPSVALSKAGKVKQFTIHKLVAKAFIPNPENLPQVNHINEIKTDNNVTNLEWCSGMYNMNYGTRLSRQIEKSSKRVLCVETNIIYPSLAEAARKNPPIRQGNISLCCQGKNGSAGGYHWQYV